MAKQQLISFYRVIDEDIEIIRVIRGDRNLCFILLVMDISTQDIINY